MEGVSQRQVHLLDYWQVLLKRRWIIYSSVLLVTGLVTLGSFLVAPKYTATVQLQIEKFRPNVLPFQEVMASYSDFRDDFYETQSRLIQSRSVARSVVRELGLMDHPAFSLSPSKIEELGLSADDVELMIADRLRGSMEVDLIRNSRLVNVSFVSREAELSAAVANSIADAYIEFNARTTYNATEQATESMTRQITSLRNEISEKERLLQEYAREQEIIPLSDQQNVTTQKLNDLSSAYTKAQTVRIEKEARYSALRESPIGAIPELMSNDLLETLSAQYARLEREYANMSKRFKPGWPAMSRLKSEMEKTAARIDEERADLHQRLLGEAREDYLAALKEEQSLEKALSDQKRIAQESNIRSIEYNNLKSEIENRRKTLEAMVTRQTETGATAGMTETPLTNVRVVDRAEVPRRPSSPRKAFNFALSLLAGLGLGVGLAFFFDYMDDSVNTPDDLSKAIGLACLGLIPAHDMQGRLRVVRSKGASGDDSRPEIDLAALRDARSQISEAYREVRTGLLVSSPGGPPRNILITSSQPREGKTATAINLAITLSQLSRKVLLVDADLRRPRLHKAMKVPNRAGLSNHLSGGEDFSGLIVPADGAPGIHLLPSGPPPPNPAELLDSREFASLVERLATEGSFDHVIFDSPPVLSVADAAIMAGRMDGVILVIQASSTPRDNVARATEKLQRVKARILGALLNKVDNSGRGRYYGGYYAYYGQEGESADEADETMESRPRFDRKSK